MATATDSRYDAFLVHMRSTAGPDVEESEIKAFYDTVVSENNGIDIIDSIIKPGDTFAHSVCMNANEGEEQKHFESSSGAAATLINLWVYSRLSFHSNDIKRKFEGNAWGITPGLPAGTLIGKMWYNDSEELAGWSRFFVGGISNYVYIKFWKGNKELAVFHSGAVGSYTGTAWGSGDWKTIG